MSRIAKGLSRYGKQAKELGLTFFGGSSFGSLRINDNSGYGKLIVADIINGDFDGAQYDSEDGLIRGEL